MNRVWPWMACALPVCLAVAVPVVAEAQPRGNRAAGRFETRRDGPDSAGDVRGDVGVSAPGPGWAPGGRSQPWNRPTRPSPGRFPPGTQPGNPARPNPNPGPAASEPVATGFLIVEGRYLPPPYTLQWRDGAVHVNGHPLPDLIEGGSASGQAWRGQVWRSPPSRMFAEIQEWFYDDGLLLSLDAETAGFVRAGEAVAIFEILLGDDPPALKADALGALNVPWIHSADWARLVDTFEPTAKLPGRVAALKEKLETPVFLGPEAQAASATLASGMTIVSIALTVFALGTLLTHRPARSRGWRGLNPTSSGCRLVLRCAILLVVLNLFDLACTLLAVQSGGFWEVNPLAHRLLDNLPAVAACKIGLVVGGTVMLVVLRRYRLTQLVSWWACVLYTVIMLRWATYNSLFLT